MYHRAHVSLYRSVPILPIYQCNDPIGGSGGLGCFPSLLLSGNSPLRGDPKRSPILVRADQLGSFSTPHSKTATWHVSSHPLSCLVWWHVSAVGSFFSKILEPTLGTIVFDTLMPIKGRFRAGNRFYRIVGSKESDISSAFCSKVREENHRYHILAEGAIALSVTLSGGALFAS